MTNKKELVKWACSVVAVIALVITNYSGEIRTSERGLRLIGNAEGCQRKPYTCPADVLTVGIGSTNAVAPLDPFKIYTKEEIAALFVKSIKQAEQCVNQYANGQKMPQGAFDALVAITNNIGCGKMRKSTLYRMARQGYSPAMCDQFPRWDKANGKPLKGLTDRRQEEKKLCLDL